MTIAEPSWAFLDSDEDQRRFHQTLSHLKRGRLSPRGDCDANLVIDRECALSGTALLGPRGRGAAIISALTDRHGRRCYAQREER